MKLNLKRPLAFFDLETTGTNIANDRIVEISLVKVYPDERIEKYTQRVNPEIPIPVEASLVHGIYDEDVKDKPTFRAIAARLINFLEGCDLGGFNIVRFDVPFLCEEFFRNNFEFEIKSRKLIDTQIIFHKMEERTLKAAYKFYCDKELLDAHSAEADTLATYEVLKAQIAKYPELPNDVDGIFEFTKLQPMIDPDRKIILDENGVEIFNFGKHKGKTLEEIYRSEPAYFNWILERDFLNTTKRFIQDFQLRMLQSKFKN